MNICIFAMVSIDAHSVCVKLDWPGERFMYVHYTVHSVHRINLLFEILKIEQIYWINKINQYWHGWHDTWCRIHMRRYDLGYIWYNPTHSFQYFIFIFIWLEMKYIWNRCFMMAPVVIQLSSRNMTPKFIKFKLIANIITPRKGTLLTSFQLKKQNKKKIRSQNKRHMTGNPTTFDTSFTACLIIIEWNQITHTDQQRQTDTKTKLKKKLNK